MVPLLTLLLISSYTALLTSSFRLNKAQYNSAIKSVWRSTSLSATVDDKVEVEDYFNNEGFSRWNKIYSDSDEVNSVQKDIRTGHQQTIDKVLEWMKTEDNKKNTVCDAGCGVGSQGAD